MQNFVPVEKLSYYFSRTVAVRGIVQNVQNQGGLIFFDVCEKKSRIKVMVIPDHQGAYAIAKKLANNLLVEAMGVVKKNPFSVQTDIYGVNSEIELEVEELRIKPIIAKEKNGQPKIAQTRTTISKRKKII